MISLVVFSDTNALNPITVNGICTSPPCAYRQALNLAWYRAGRHPSPQETVSQ